MFATVDSWPAGRARLTWALFRYPYDPAEDYFFIGGNYMHLNQPDFTRQIFSKKELDECFTYDPRQLELSISRTFACWFVVRPREGMIADRTHAASKAGHPENEEWLFT
jgi:hypothetical protein